MKPIDGQPRVGLLTTRCSEHVPKGGMSARLLHSHRATYDRPRSGHRPVSSIARKNGERPDQSKNFRSARGDVKREKGVTG